VGLGVARRLLERCQQSDPSDAFAPIIAQAEARWQRLSQQLFAAANVPPSKSETTSLRASINAFLSRLAATLLTLTKGSGYARLHPAQRDFREAMFFLVWSAPTALRQETLAQLWGKTGKA